MKKSILSLEGAKSLNKEEQKSINGGMPSLFCFGKPEGTPCGNGRVCKYSYPQVPYLACLP